MNHAGAAASWIVAWSSVARFTYPLSISTAAGPQSVRPPQFADTTSSLRSHAGDVNDELALS